MKTGQPPTHVLAAFAVAGTLANLPGGHGQVWATKKVVLKPVDDDAQAAWTAALVTQVEHRGFRLARPIPASDGRWVVDGWSAWTRQVGEHSSTRWPELLAAAAAFHAAVADVPKPEFIERRADRWRVADRVAWGELPPTKIGKVSHVDRLLAARQPLDIPSQIVHGDLVGNVLFAEGLPPAIIDLSLYWRPVGYSAAVVVVDALAWESASPSILGLIEHFVGWPQLLLRAAIFRIVVSALARRAEPWRDDLSDHYRPLVELTLSVATGAAR